MIKELFAISFCMIILIKCQIFSNRYEIISNITIPEFAFERNQLESLNYSSSFRVFDNQHDCAVSCNMNENCRTALYKDTQCILFDARYDEDRFLQSENTLVYEKLFYNYCSELNIGKL